MNVAAGELPTCMVPRITCFRPIPYNANTQLEEAMGILGVCLLLLIPVVAHSQGQPEAVYNPYNLSPSLRDQAIDALIKKDSVAARPLLERWLDVSPRDWRAWYWLAGIYAGEGDNARAIEAFEKSSEAGLLDTDDPVTNPAFETIRSSPRMIYPPFCSHAHRRNVYCHAAPGL
jgi:hypothetical protein